MEMPAAETQQALRQRIAQLRADLTALEGRLAVSPGPRTRFSAACVAATPQDSATEHVPAAPGTPAQDTPLAIAAG